MSGWQLVRIWGLATLWAALPVLAIGAEPTTATSGPVTATLRVDRETAHVAEPVLLTLEVTAPSGVRVELPSLAKRLGDFDVRNVERTPDVPAPDGDARRWLLEATLDTIKTGSLTIPSLEVHFALPENPQSFDTVATKPQTIQIQSVIEADPDPTKFRDIKETLDLAAPSSPTSSAIAWAAAGVGGALALALTAALVVRRRRGPSPADWALASLAELRRLPVANDADAEAAYNEAADLLREYCELEYDLPLLARTTREMLAEMNQLADGQPALLARLAAMASLADEIKFARRGVSEQQLHDAFDQAEQFIRESEASRRAAVKEGD
jgi:hypothetical protein